MLLDFEKNPDLYDTSSEEDDTDTHAKSLATERNADANALYLLRPFMSVSTEDNFNATTLQNYARNCRQSHIDGIRYDQDANTLLYARTITSKKLGGLATSRTSK